VLGPLETMVEVFQELDEAEGKKSSDV